MSQEDFDQRLSEQVTTLSTKLVTEVAKSSEFEEALLQVRKENAALKSKAEETASMLEKYEDLRQQNQSLVQQYEQLQKEHNQLKEEKNVAEEKNKQLEGEVEDLTASLFSEANEMVSNASREAYNFKLKNRKLFEELSEKDSIIGNLQDELRDLKELFIKMEEQTRNAGSSRANTPKTFTNSERFTDEDDPARTRGFGADADDSVAHDDFSDDEVGFVLNQLIYGPRTRSIRLDLPQYQQDFKAFVYSIIRKEFAFDLASLKALKYFKKIWTTEIEPSLGCAPPSLSGATFMNRWTKGKSFWSLIVEGKAVIEPVAGVNETFKLSYKGAKSGNAVPVALREPCGICGEAKDDLLEHARLYSLKLYGPAADSYKNSGSETISIAGEKHEVVGNYPLCNYCLVKLRAICDFFAKLRSIHSNIYKLQPNSVFENVVPANSFQFKRASTELLQGPVSKVEDEPILIKLYLMLLVLRAKIFWAGVGFWDTLEDIESLNFDDIKSDVFKRFVSDNVAYTSADLEEVQGEPKSESKQEATGLFGKTQTEENEEKKRESKSNVEPQTKEPMARKKPQELETDVDIPQRVQSLEVQAPKPVNESAKLKENIQEVVPEPVNEVEKQSLDKEAVEKDLEKEEDVVSLKSEKEQKSEPEPEPEQKAPNASEGKVSDMVKKLSENQSPAKKNKKKNKAPKPKETDDSPEDVIQENSEDVQAEPPLSRHKSKSKAFKKKINKDLDDTLSMLQESIE